MTQMKALKLAGIFLGLALLVITAGTADAAQPLGTDFTYQGQLTLSGVPVNNTCDFQFSLFDEATLGAQVGTTQSNNVVSVANGLFAVLLDFGPGAFNGQARWLETSVRCPTGGSFTTLLPRQALTATPYALHASTVADGSVTSAKIADGTIGNADLAPGAFANITGVGPLGSLSVSGATNLATTSGNVGIGTTSPGERLDVAGNILGGTPALTVRSNNGFGNPQGSGSGLGGAGGTLSLLSGSAGVSAGAGGTRPSGGDIVLQTGLAGTGGLFAPGNDGAISFLTGITERMRISSNGNVGIGTANPNIAELAIETDQDWTTLQETAYGSGKFPTINLRKANGTQALPTPTLSGDILASIYGQGCCGDPNNPSGVWLMGGAAMISFVARENFSNTSGAGAITFQTASPGTVGSLEKMRLDENGNLGIGTTGPQSALQVIGYTQLDLTAGAPPTTDCDGASERGRMKVDSAAGLLYICVTSGWISK
jgi:hypothetical protein